MSIMQRLRAFGRWIAQPQGDSSSLRFQHLRASSPTPAVRSVPAPIVDEPGVDPSRGNAAKLVNRLSLITSGRETATRIARAFNTALPVENRFGLSGRSREIDRLAQAVIHQGKHGIIFGARGSGKTSLARVFGDLADEAGCYVIYNSASGETSFADLFRPCLDYLPAPGHAASAIAALKHTQFSVRELANLFLDVPRQTIVVLDEFDRIENAQTKEDVAGLLKLLTDMHAPVQVLLVGIAGNVDDLLIAHPSLRRHLVALQVLPIDIPDLTDLIISCSRDADMDIHHDLAHALAAAAMGSPYHARIFGFHAAQVAAARNSRTIEDADLAEGMAHSLADWRDVSIQTERTVRHIVADDPQAAVVMILTAGTAAYTPLFNRAALVENARIHLDTGIDWATVIDSVIARLHPVLHESSEAEAYRFQDTLAPQFVKLIVATQSRGIPQENKNDTKMSDAAHLLFAGLKQP